MGRDMTSVIPFPLIRRRRFVMRNAIRLEAVPHKTAEKILAATLKQQTEVMRRRSIAGAVIDAETRSLESAIRAELWRLIILRPGNGVA